MAGMLFVPPGSHELDECRRRALKRGSAGVCCPKLKHCSTRATETKLLTASGTGAGQERRPDRGDGPMLVQEKHGETGSRNARWNRPAVSSTPASGEGQWRRQSVRQ
jgi:hypothetical protein